MQPGTEQKPHCVEDIHADQLFNFIEEYTCLSIPKRTYIHRQIALISPNYKSINDILFVDSEE